MSTDAKAPRLNALNRRRTVRQRVHARAYASFATPSQDTPVTYEVVDISETGVALRCALSMPKNQDVELFLDLSESSKRISATVSVVWSQAAGCIGLHFSELAPSDREHLREWLFVNAMMAAANAGRVLRVPPMNADVLEQERKDSQTNDGISALRREIELLGPNIEAVLSLVVSRSRPLLRASGVAVALVERDAKTMTCRASMGESAPPVGTILEVGLGFSGECVRSGRVLRCEDTETSDFVDRQSCRALSIRSMLAAPIRAAHGVIGLLELFSEKPNAFGQNDEGALQDIAQSISNAMDRSKPLESAKTSVPKTIWSGNAAEEDGVGSPLSSDDGPVISEIPRARLYVLYGLAIAIALILGFLFVPRVQEKLHARGSADTKPSLPEALGRTVNSDPPSLDFREIRQLRDLAILRNPAAENALGLLYASGDGQHAIKQDQEEAVFWFTRAAQDGSVDAQYKLGLLYWDGHGVPKDLQKAYFWTLLARAAGQPGSEDLAKVLANHITRTQAKAVEQQATSWSRQHGSRVTPDVTH